MKKIFLTSLFVLISYLIFSQKEQIISGANTISSMVSSDGKGYVWGNNLVGTTRGLLGTGNTGASFLATPQQIILPNNKSFSQLNCGSGSHFMALDCDRWVWAWGENSFGQVGNGQAQLNSIVTSPTRVVVSTASELKGTKWGLDGFLTNVTTVYAANTASFAILDDGRLVSWGANGNSTAGTSPGMFDYVAQLGHGVIPPAGAVQNITTPKYVRLPNGNPLENVINVFSADNVTYALVDLDDDGVGTVYSWGNGDNGKLGRNANGTANPANGGTVVDAFARPVLYVDGKVMDNIVEINAGDVFGMALDVNGYIWTWGNGGWNNATGNSIVNLTSSAPGRVIKGNTTGLSNDGIYLLAKSISGGQGFGMAVSKDNKAVAWGGNGSNCSSGGLTGTGVTTTGIVPSYIEYGANLVHNDVVFINRGDTWGYYGRKNGEVFTWGCNLYGQLGIGNTTAQVRAVKFSPPTAIEFKDPTPKAYINNSNKIVCKGFSDTIICENNIPSLKYSSYLIKWYKNEVIIKQGILSESTNKLVVTDSGKYKVELLYNAQTLCDIAKESKKTNTYSYSNKNIITPTNLIHCTDTAKVWLFTNDPANKPVFDWYSAATGSQKLASSIGKDTIKINLSGIPSDNFANKKLYVEQITENFGTLLPKVTPCRNGSSYGTSLNTSNLIFSIDKPTRIFSLNALLKADIFQNNTSVTKDFKVYIKNTELVENRGLITGKTILDSAIYTLKINNSTQQLNEQLATFNFTKVLQPGTYSLYMENVGNISNGLLSVYSCRESTTSVPVLNNIKHIGFSNFLNFSTSGDNFFFNIKFGTDKLVCDRNEVVLKNECPCAIPIPDLAFKTCLLNNPVININGDAEINCEEAENFAGTIVCGQKGIESLVGIEYFTSLKGLNIYRNNVSTLDLSKNLELTLLETYQNQITTIDVSKNTKLTYFSVGQNLVTSLDLSKNLLLDSVFCAANSIQELDVSMLKKLIYFACSSNSLTKLNVANGNNSNFVIFNSLDNPDLDCIQVDNKTYSETNWPNRDAKAIFSENCSVFTGLESKGKTMELFPNPFTDYTSIKIGEEYNYTIIDSQGKIMEEGVGTSTTKFGQQLNSGHFILKINLANEVRTLSIYKL